MISDDKIWRLSDDVIGTYDIISKNSFSFSKHFFILCFFKLHSPITDTDDDTIEEKQEVKKEEVMEGVVDENTPPER